MVDEILAWLRIPDTPRNREVLGVLVAEALATVEKEVDWYFGPPRSVEEFLTGTGSMVLYLRQPPSPDHPLVIAERRSSDNWETVPSSTFNVAKRRVYRDRGWAPGCRNYRAQYHEGFAEVPGDVKSLVKQMVATTWKTNGGAFLSERIGDYSYTRGDVTSHPVLWKTVTNNWKRGKI